MKSVIIGGNFGKDTKESSVINKLAESIVSSKLNGGTINDIVYVSENLEAYDLIVWAPNINNDIEKIYPKKGNGSVLICSKVLRENRDFGDAVARIFKMNANAVIAIDSTSKPFMFNLIDALGNVWCKTSNIDELALSIDKLYKWTKASTRVRSNNIVFDDTELCNLELTELCDVVRTVADKVENERGGRYFGNVSTRCSKMFPSYRISDDIILMSGRNTAKDRLTTDDFVFTKLLNGDVLYHGDKKPSVDTPIQLNMYKEFKNINFIIHGHAYIESAETTEHYFPCGDLRELSVVKDKLDSNTTRIVLNLKNHGFVIGASTLDELKEIINISNFKYRNIGQELAHE